MATAKITFATPTDDTTPSKYLDILIYDGTVGNEVLYETILGDDPRKSIVGGNIEITGIPVTPGTTYNFSAKARDIAGNLSVAFSPITIFSASSEIGTIFSVDFNTISALDYANKFTENIITAGTTVNLDGGFLKVLGALGAAPYNDYIFYNDYITGLEQWEIIVEFISKSYTNLYEGAGAGYQSATAHGSLRYDQFNGWRNTADANVNNILAINFDGGNATPPYLIPPPGIAQGLDKKMQVKLTKNQNVITATYSDITGVPVSAQADQTFDISTTSGVELTPKSSYALLSHIGGENWFTKISLSSASAISPNWAHIHDSQGVSYNTTTPDKSIIPQLRILKPSLTFTPTGGQSDTLETALLKAPEYLKINITKASIDLGTNDLLTQSVATANTRLADLITLLQGQGVTKFILFTPAPRGGSTKQRDMAADMVTTYGALPDFVVIDVFTQFDNGANALDPIDSDDGTHLKDAGHLWKAQQYAAAIDII